MKMSKREFLKSTGTAVAGGMLSQLTRAEQHAVPRENWAGNITYSTGNLQVPATMDEVRSVVKEATKLRALGSRHSFNTIADSTVEQISLKALRDIVIDEKAGTVTVDGGVAYGRLALVIDAKDFALPNLASLPHISVAGAIATATHGSGLQNGNLATPVYALEIATADGKVIRLSHEKDGDSFLGAVVGLGALGVVTRVTLDLLPTYEVAQSGVAYVPEGRGIFGNLSVEETLRMAARPGRSAAAQARAKAGQDWHYARVLETFPRLQERLRHGGQQLSGGEQQMLTIGRALMTNPELLILDEATEGLAPKIAREIWRIVRAVGESGIATVIVDKNFAAVNTITDRNLILVKGEVVFDGPAAELRARPEVHRRYLGV